MSFIFLVWAATFLARNSFGEIETCQYVTIEDNQVTQERRFSSQAEQDLYEALQRKKRVRETS